MSNLPQSDWILAGRFVDRDLPDAEAARAKSRMATDPQFAAAVEELRAQSNLFNSLPTFKPATDLKERTAQASLDQVKAIMGAWPIEDSNKLSSGNAAATTNSFDWKSTVALVASLAGIFVISSMLWLPTINDSETHDLAMKTAPAEVAAANESDAAKGGELADRYAYSEQEFAEPIVAGKAGGLVKRKKAFSSKASPSPAPSFSPLVAKAEASADQPAGLAPTHGIAKGSAGIGGAKQMAKKFDAPLPEIGPMSGTPMKRINAPAIQNKKALAVSANAPIEQIWCVHQDHDMSREAVSQILNLNEIKVQRQQPPSSVYANKEPAEAFYVAATQQQMMLAMSQISNNADVEMIQLPNSVNSPIADAIAQQFAEATPETKRAEDAAITSQLQQQEVAPRFRKPKSQALAQQLFANSLPRNFTPSGPVPPILNSNSDLGSLNSESDAKRLDEPVAQRRASSSDLANESRNNDRHLLPRLEMNDDEALESEKKLEELAFDSDAAEGSGNSPFQSGQSPSKSQLPGEPDGVVGESGDQLRQYLILVRGGEEEK